MIKRLIYTLSLFMLTSYSHGQTMESSYVKWLKSQDTMKVQKPKVDTTKIKTPIKK